MVVWSVACAKESQAGAVRWSRHVEVFALGGPMPEAIHLLQIAVECAGKRYFLQRFNGTKAVHLT